MSSWINTEEVRKTINTLFPGGKLFEIRCVKGKRIISGYFTDADTAINELEKHNLSGFNVYITINNPATACYSRKQHNRFIENVSTTADKDIERLQSIPFDCDPERLADISSTDEEKELAKRVCEQLWNFFKERYIPVNLFADSGNGYHICLKIDLDATKENAALVERVIKLVSACFSIPGVKVDETVSNPDSILKLYGTLAQKGANTEERPHRMSKLIWAAKEPQAVTREQLQAIVDELQPRYDKLHPANTGKGGKKSAKNGSSGGSGYDLDKFRSWLDSTEVGYKEGVCSNGNSMFLLDECFFDSNHKNGDAKIWYNLDGSIGYYCHHDHCRGKDWAEVLSLPTIPEYYDKTGYNFPISGEDPAQGSRINDEELPNITNYGVIKDNPPELSPELIEGILRQGHKLLISSSSKAGKSFLDIELAVCIAEGRQWLKWNCMQGKVLYINLEIDSASFYNRVRKVYESMGITPSNNLDIWNLRGYSAPLDKLLPVIIARAKGMQYAAIIIDPIYKVITGDENSATDMAHFCNQFDAICIETGASVIYTHHHSKGGQGYKAAIDRGSGSGVFGRDPDAVLDLTEIEPKDVDVTLAEGQTAWRVEGCLREFGWFKPFEIVFDYPVHRIIDGLEDADYKSGASAATNRMRGNKAAAERKNANKESNLNILERFTQYPETGLTVKEMVLRLEPELKDNEQLLESKAKTLRNWLKEDDGNLFKEMPPAGKAKRYIPKNYGQWEDMTIIV